MWENGLLKDNRGFKLSSRKDNPPSTENLPNLEELLAVQSGLLLRASKRERENLATSTAFICRVANVGRGRVATTDVVENVDVISNAGDAVQCAERREGVVVVNAEVSSNGGEAVQSVE